MAILTIAREFGSGGREVGEAVANLLGYEYIDKEKILSEMKALGHQWEEWARELDEHSPSIWERYDWTFRGFGALVQNIILNHALKDNVVIMGRGGSFLFRDTSHALRVRIVAPQEMRISAIMTRQSVDRKMARWLIEKVDQEREGFVYSLYGKHVNDPSEYDLVIDMADKSKEDAATLIVSLLKEKNQKRTDAYQATLRMRSEAARIKVGLLTDPTVNLPTLDVDYDGKQIVIRGIIHNPKEQKKVESLAQKLAGDLPMKCELVYRV